LPSKTRRSQKAHLDFTAEVTDRCALADIANGDKSVAAAFDAFLKTLDAWWEKHLLGIEAFALSNGKKGNAYAPQRSLLASIEHRASRAPSS
jgi:hypothetical protein